MPSSTIAEAEVGGMDLLPEAFRKLPFSIQAFILGFVVLHFAGIGVLLAMHFNAKKKRDSGKFD